MKLLSWIRTIKHNGLDQSKKFKGDICCLRAQVSSEIQGIRTNSFSFSGPSHDPKSFGVEEWFDEVGFHGFPAIGTLGMDPGTPKFAALVSEDVTGEKKEMAKLVTEKLNKILEKYPKETDIRRVEKSNAEEDRESDVCTQQGHDLFQSSIEITKGINEVKKKKGLLTSLFKRRKIVEGECNCMEKHGARDLIKMIFEKLHGSSSKTKKDLRKSVQIVRSKVHPVLYTPTRDENKINDRRRCINHCNIMVPSLTSEFLGSSSILEPNRKRENWIKTDAEYLVLEL